MGNPFVRAVVQMLLVHDPQRGTPEYWVQDRFAETCANVDSPEHWAMRFLRLKNAEFGCNIEGEWGVGDGYVYAKPSQVAVCFLKNQRARRMIVPDFVFTEFEKNEEKLLGRPSIAEEYTALMKRLRERNENQGGPAL